MSKKEEEARLATLEAQERGDSTLPAYSASPPQRPTTASPFDFPSYSPPPAFAAGSSITSASSSTQSQRHIAIPQITSDQASPFLDAYARPLLRYGITPESWHAFLTTMSAFLAAKVSDQALSHAADIGRNVANVPKQFGQGTVGHAKSVGKDIHDSAKSGNILGAAMGIVGGGIGLSVGTAVRAVGAAVSLPGIVIGAAAQKPQTPKARAAVYAAAANKKWLSVRGLRAQLIDTVELANISGLSVTSLLDLARASSDHSAAGQINAMNGYISELEISAEARLDLGASTLWLILFQEDGATLVPEVRGHEKR